MALKCPSVAKVGFMDYTRNEKPSLASTKLGLKWFHSLNESILFPLELKIKKKTRDFLYFFPDHQGRRS